MLPSPLVLLLVVTVLPPAVFGSIELDQSEVPNACQTICRPIVLLTNACDGKSQAARHRVRDAHRARDNGFPAPPSNGPLVPPSGGLDSFHPGPTPPPGPPFAQDSYTETATSSTSSTSSTTTTPSPISTTTSYTTTSSSQSRDASPSATSQDSSSTNSTAEALRKAQRQCICQNRSFDVAGVAGLCASCMEQYGDGRKKTDMNSIMAECGFTSTTYAPSATTAAEGITIVAMIPTVVPKGQKGASGSGGPSQDLSSEMDSGGTRMLSGLLVGTAAQALCAGFLAMLVAL